MNEPQDHASCEFPPTNGTAAQLADRDRIDNAIAAERTRVDEALTRSSNDNQDDVTALIRSERQETDRGMDEERDRADANSVRSSQRFADEIQAHSETRSSLKSRDEFMAIASHDLRNPIGVISTCATMLLDDPLHHRMNPEIRHWIELMKRNADTALSMIHDLLDMERLSLGKVDLHLERHELGNVIREAVENHLQAAVAKKIVLRELGSQAPVFVTCDRERVLQILSNLVGNALRFTPSGGTVSIHVVSQGDEVRVTVADTGPGIPFQKQSQIFERFAQVNSKNRQGLGLGLYISKMLVENHGGRIWVESRMGEGSAFHFTLATTLTPAHQS